MSGAYLQTVASIAFTLGLLGGIAIGWFFADVIEFYWLRPRRRHL